MTINYKTINKEGASSARPEIFGRARLVLFGGEFAQARGVFV